MRTMIAEKAIDRKRMVAGTEWPFVVELTRFSTPFSKKAQWNVTCVCNGIAEWSENFTTKREALKRFDSAE